MTERIITQKDLQRWREESLRVANHLYSDYHVLRFLSRVPLIVLPKDSKSMYYGRAHPEPPRIEVYRTNPSINFSQKNWEIYNQSGMDHELVGHLYHMLGIFSDPRESTALETQEEMAKHRAKENPDWIEISELIPIFAKTRLGEKKLK